MGLSNFMKVSPEEMSPGTELAETWENSQDVRKARRSVACLKTHHYACFWTPGHLIILGHTTRKWSTWKRNGTQVLILKNVNYSLEMFMPLPQFAKLNQVRRGRDARNKSTSWAGNRATRHMQGMDISQWGENKRRKKLRRCWKRGGERRKWRHWTKGNKKGN